MQAGGFFARLGLPVAALALAAVGCGPQAESIKIDGSSTVGPISKAVAEAYRDVDPNARITVNISGTGNGMKKFTKGEIDICDASRGIKPSEIEKLEKLGIGFTEFSVAFDGIAVVVNSGNDWCESLTVEQLASIWRPESPVQKWNELDPTWPDEKIKLYGPGLNSGTFEYFTDEIVGEAFSCRDDFSPSEDDNTLVTGVSSDEYSMGYFGFAYYAENKDKLNVLGVSADGGDPIVPGTDTIRDKSYAPLSRPLFIYVRNDSLAKPGSAAFVKFYLDNAAKLVNKVGYVPVSDDVAASNLAKFEEATK